MRKFMLAALLLLPTYGAPPAHAVGAGEFTADITLNGFGFGASDGTARLCVSGVNDSVLIVNPAVCSSLTGSPAANVFATFTLVQDPGLCPVQGAANGVFNGAINGTFTWVRLGAVAVIGGTATGVAVFTVTSPLGNPCGTPITQTVKATAAGTFVIVP